MLTNQLWYRKFGVRLPQQLISPIISELSALELPMQSIYHYLTYDGVSSGPPNDDFLFRNIKKPIMVSHVQDVGAQLGNPRKQAVNVPTMIRDYHNQHRRMRPLRNIVSATKDPSSLVVYNYCLINKTYRYVRSFFTEYHKWYNTFAAAMDTLVSISLETNSQNYFISGVPRLLPSVAQLTLASTSEMTQSLLKAFDNKESYLLLELWKWLGDNRQSSLFNKIPNNKIHLVNIIYQESGKWVVINLGVLNSFRNGLEKDTDFVIESKLKMESVQVQKRFLKMMMTIMEIRTVTTHVQVNDNDIKNINIITGNEITTNAPEHENVHVETEDDDDEEQLNQTIPDQILEVPEVVIQPVEIDLDNDNEEEDEETIRLRIKEEDDLIDRDLISLNEIVKKQEEKNNNVNTSSVQDILDAPDTNLEDGIFDICDKLADDGLLTAGEYRRFTRLATGYKTIISPDGKTPLNDYINIDPKDLIIDESSKLVDSSSIFDKSMLSSSMVDFDSRYISNVLSKDTAAMVLNVQRAGIAVVNYKVEKVRDIMGDYEIHMLKLAPIEGLPSTIKFKLPVVDVEGRFTSNNVKYTMRKQRGDLPIRKTDYNRVALTSYYGKSFVNRGRKKSGDYGYWLQTNIMEKGLSKLDTDITQLIPANVFDNKLKAPRAYTAISMSFKSFVVRGFTLSFDRKDVLKTYPLDVLNVYEKDGNLVIGVNQHSVYLVMDKDGSVYTTENDTLNLFGTLESFLNIPTSNASVEYTDLVVFGKEIPIGIILSYKMGFDNLLKLLKVEPRRVNAGSRLNMEANEYSLAFSDETLIFSKDDKLATIILAGFNEYHKAIKMFSVYSFDKHGVYLNLLDSNNLGVRYLREIDLMYNMFIDPITKDLLIEMKEPVTFQGLLLRSCEMLLTDEHPDELDPAYMRIKGYERLSGAVYTELIQSIRVHNGKLGKSNQAIEMNPYAVWKRISEDPSKGQVSEMNPIKALKENEAVTYAGAGGRSKVSMTGHTRKYHDNDMGTISESTVDSSDVGINIFLSANPQFTSLRGMSKRLDYNKAGPTALLSTSALLAPGSDRDD